MRGTARRFFAGSSTRLRLPREQNEIEATVVIARSRLLRPRSGIAARPARLNHKELSMTEAVIVGINTHHDRVLAGGPIATGVM